VDKTSVLIVRFAKNHPLPDGQQRAAWMTMRALLESTAARGVPCRTSMTPSGQSSPPVIRGRVRPQGRRLQRHC
jgi:hypothetical protein